MIKEDYCNYKLTVIGLIKGLFTGHAFYAVAHYRLANWLYRHHVKMLPEMITYRNIRRHGCEISPVATIGGYFDPPYNGYCHRMLCTSRKKS